MAAPTTPALDATPDLGPAGFVFDNSYARELDGLVVAWKAAPAPAPEMVKFNRALASELGLNGDWLDSNNGAQLFAGNAVPPGAQPVAQAYAGHQFGGFSPQLGDGRALLLGEVIDQQGQRRDIAFKGSGRTPFSRGGDGLAAIGPMLREYLISEAMHALGIPSTRSLAVVRTGDQALRDSGPLPGAVLTRVASSHIRVGTFQFVAARQDLGLLQRLLDHSIARHDPGLKDHEQPALAFVQAVAERQARLIAQWMGVGFIHGVMNTDNMALSGETIDYGPCAFMDTYDPGTVFSSIDRGGRYAYANQPEIARWNLARLAETLLPLMHADTDQAVALATQVINDFPARYQRHWLALMRGKLGLAPNKGMGQGAEPGPDPLAETPHDADDLALAQDFLTGLQQRGADFTLAFRGLADLAESSGAATPAETSPGAGGADSPPDAAWLARWRARCTLDSRTAEQRAAAMRQANAIHIPRNHLVEQALTAASERADMAPFEQLLAAVTQPFDAGAADHRYRLPAPAELAAGYKTFCGT